MKGIIMAGGRGTRLYPMTKMISKHLLPIYDKPMIYYPLSILLLMGIKDILLITTPDDLPLYQKILSDGSRLGVGIRYIVQNEPRGLADAFLLGSNFIENDPVCLILGDNIFYGQSLTALLKKAVDKINDGYGACIFGYPVKDSRPFGVVEIDDDMNVLSIEEKPEYPKSNYAVPGLYFYDNNVIRFVKEITPSRRGELEITTLNNLYLSQGALALELMGRGMAWLDTGTPEGILKASVFIEAIQSRQGYYIACIEEIAWRKGFISSEQLFCLGKEMQSTNYGQYILSLVSDKW